MPQRSCSLLPNTNALSGRGCPRDRLLICRRKPLFCFCDVRPPRNKGRRNQPGQSRPASGRIMSLTRSREPQGRSPLSRQTRPKSRRGHERSIIWQIRAFIFVSIRPVRQAVGGRPVFLQLRPKIGADPNRSFHRLKRALQMGNPANAICSSREMVRNLAIFDPRMGVTSK